MKYGILNDLIGQRAGVPSIKLPQGMVNEGSSFVHYVRNSVRRVPGRETALATTTDGNPILHYHYHQSVGGEDYLFAFTKAHIYYWNGTDWTTMFTCSADCTRWSTADFGTYVVATNNVDKVQYWDDEAPSTAFADLGSANGIEYATGTYLTKAEYVIVHWRYLHLLSTYEDGTAYRNVDRWCSAGDITDWDQDGAGDAGYRVLGPNDEIMGAGIYNVQGANQLIIFTQRTVNAAWLVTADTVYESQDIMTETGCAAPGTVVNGPDGNLYFLSATMSGTRAVRRVYDPNSLGYDVQTILDEANPSLMEKAVAQYMSRWDELWFAIPSGGDSTGNDVVLPFNLLTQTWQPKVPIDVYAFGFWSQQSTEYIDDISDIIDTVDRTIDSFAPISGEPIRLVSDANGESYAVNEGTQDKGVDYTGALVLSVMLEPQYFNRVKRVHGGWFYFKSRPGTAHTVTVSTRKEDSGTYVNHGTVELDGDGEIVRQWLRTGLRARHFEVKLAAQNDFAFLGVIFDYDVLGSRR